MEILSSIDEEDRIYSALFFVTARINQDYLVHFSGGLFFSQRASVTLFIQLYKLSENKVRR